MAVLRIPLTKEVHFGRYILHLRIQCVSSFAVRSFLRSILLLVLSKCVSCKAHTERWCTGPTVMAMIQRDITDATSAMLESVWDLIKHSICLSTLPSHGLYPACRFAWQSLRAIRHGTRLHDLWRKTFLIHKSQKDQLKIHAQSVLLQPVISVTVGQRRRAATETKVLPPLILDLRHKKHKWVEACAQTRARTRTEGDEEVLMGIFVLFCYCGLKRIA